MRYIILVVSIFFLIEGAEAQNKSIKKPDITFTESTHDFGILKNVNSAKWKFVFLNTGTAPLLLKDVKPSCHCTAPVWPKKPINPGDTSSIFVTFDTKGSAGESFNKSIAITTNIPDATGKDKIVTIFIKGKVVFEPQPNK
jgi:hypothetical protein